MQISAKKDAVKKFFTYSLQICRMCNLPSWDKCLQCSMHRILCFIDVRRHFTFDRAHGTGLIILTKNISQTVSYLWSGLIAVLHT